MIRIVRGMQGIRYHGGKPIVDVRSCKLGKGQQFFEFVYIQHFRLQAVPTETRWGAKNFEIPLQVLLKSFEKDNIAS